MFRRLAWSSAVAALTATLATGLATGAPASAAPAKSGTIAKSNAEVAAAMANPNVRMVRNISHRELKAGMPIVENDGDLIGTVEKVAGNTIIVGDGTQFWRVPIEQIYAYSDGGKEDHFASRLTKDQLEPDVRLGG